MGFLLVIVCERSVAFINVLFTEMFLPHAIGELQFPNPAIPALPARQSDQDETQGRSLQSID
jgi:hypothetical protein